MNFAKLFESIESAVKQSPDAKAGWNTLVEVADRNSGRKRATALDAVDIDGDVAAVRRELRRIVRSTPIPTAVDTLYFGLFDLSVEGSNADEIGFYVAGVDGFDPEDPDSLVDPVYFPDDCYLEARVLHAIKMAANADPPHRDLYEYGLALGAAGLLARFSVQGRLARYRLVVGFDDVDYLVLSENGA